MKRAQLLAALSVVVLAACETSPPALLQVFDVKPEQVEANDTLVVRGAGYPPGEVGVLELSGVVHRAGSETETGFRLETKVRSESDDRVVLELDDEVVRAFTETEGGARHATFRGRATVSFAPGLEGAPPIHGSGDIVLDVYPKDAIAEAELASFYGAELRPVPDGLELVSLIPEGRLARAGAEAHDRVVSMDGLSVLGEGDLQPRAGQRHARLGVVAAGALPTESPTLLTVDVAGYEPRPAADFRWTLALVVPLALWLLASQSRWSHGLAWLWSLIVRREDQYGGSWAERVRARAPSGFASFLAVSALFGAIRLDLVPALGDLSLALLYALIAALELVGAFLVGGRGNRRWSTARALASTFRNIPLQLTLALAFLAVVLQRASLGLNSAEPSSPWSSPSDLLACFVLVTLALGRPSTGRSGFDFGGELQRLAALLLVGTVVSVFLSGAMPQSIAAAPTRAVLGGQLMLTLGYLTWLVVQRGLYKTRVGEIGTLTQRLLLPTALLATALGPVWLAEVWPEWLRDSVRSGLLAILLTATFTPLLLLVTRRRLRDGATATNPWL